MDIKVNIFIKYFTLISRSAIMILEIKIKGGIVWKIKT